MQSKLCKVNCLLHTSHTTLNTQHLTLNTQHSTLNNQQSTINTQHSTLNTQHSTLNAQHSTLNTQYSALNTQHSIPNTQHSTLNTKSVCALILGRNHIYARIVVSSLNGNLKAHIHSHTWDKLYICHECEARFSQNNNAEYQ